MQNEKSASPVEGYTPLKYLCQAKGNLYLASNDETNKLAVIKVFPYKTEVQPAYEQERDIICRLEHPNIIRFYDCKDHATMMMGKSERKFSYIVMEYAQYGDLCDHVINNGAFSEVLTRTIFHKIIDAVSYMHEVGIAHMDLKADNVMVDGNYNIKIIDFDQSLVMETAGIRFRSRGTSNYRCPEVIKGVSKNLKACDVYSLGVVLFILFSRHYPYLEVIEDDIVSYNEYYPLMKENPNEFWRQHNMLKENPSPFSPSFKELIMGMLKPNPDERTTLEEVQHSTWYNGPVYEEEEFKREMRRHMKKA